MSRKALVLLLIATLVAGLPSETVSAKKKKKKKKAPPVCASYTPGELGAGASTLTVTSAATADAPAVQTVSLPPSAADITQGDPEVTFFNIQADPAATEAGLYVLMEFPTNRDYDLWLRYADGSAGASAHEFNTIYVGSTYPPGISGNNSHGNESTATSEALVGIRTPDCGGWTLEVQNWLGEGGDFDIQVWLGEPAIDPIPPGEQP